LFWGSATWSHGKSLNGFKFKMSGWIIPKGYINKIKNHGEEGEIED
jgi:hypothetical protein